MHIKEETTLMPHSVSDRPWSKLGVNIFELQGQQYLVIVDYSSGFIEIDPLTHMTAKHVINHCKSQFLVWNTRHFDIRQWSPVFQSRVSTVCQAVSD